MTYWGFRGQHCRLYLGLTKRKKSYFIFNLKDHGMFLLTDEPIQWFMILQTPMDNHCREGSEVSRKKWEVLKVLKLRLFRLLESLRSLNFKTFKTFIKKITESKEGMLQFYWPKICHDPKRLPTEKGKNQNGGTLSFLGKTVFLVKMILEVLTLRLF